jgi:glycosyltransferase involved in cell wall biosynthesis
MFERPKLPGAEFTLGMIGIAPWRKRPDLGLDVLDILVRRDSRFRLAIKSKQPWDYWWIWRRPEEQTAYAAWYERLRSRPALANAVNFDGFGPDVPVWLRRVGWVLSTSDDESFHLAPAEGMASGAVPALLPWPGADTIYDPAWIHDSPEAMAEVIAGAVASGEWADLRRAARDQVIASFPLDAVCGAWREICLRDRAPDADRATLVGWARDSAEQASRGPLR